MMTRTTDLERLALEELLAIANSPRRIGWYTREEYRDAARALQHLEMRSLVRYEGDLPMKTPMMFGYKLTRKGANACRAAVDAYEQSVRTIGRR